MNILLYSESKEGITEAIQGLKRIKDLEIVTATSMPTIKKYMTKLI